MKNLNIDICCGARCTMMGAIDLLEKAESFKSVFPNDNIIIQAVPFCFTVKHGKIRAQHNIETKQYRRE